MFKYNFKELDELIIRGCILMSLTGLLYVVTFFIGAFGLIAWFIIREIMILNYAHLNAKGISLENRISSFIEKMIRRNKVDLEKTKEVALEQKVNNKDTQRLELLTKLQNASNLISKLPLSLQNEYKKELLIKLNKYSKVVSDSINRENLILESEDFELIKFSVYVDNFIEKIQKLIKEEEYKAKINSIRENLDCDYTDELISSSVLKRKLKK